MKKFPYDDSFINEFKSFLLNDLELDVDLYLDDLVDYGSIQVDFRELLDLIEINKIFLWLINRVNGYSVLIDFVPYGFIIKF